jgi:hypothetical protein
MSEHHPPAEAGRAKSIPRVDALAASDAGDDVRYSKVLVTGLGRSGTSAIADLLEQLGFDGGPDLHPVLREDVNLRRLLLTGEHVLLAEALRARTAGNARCYWKEPKLYAAGDRLVGALEPDWVVIAVFRDLVGIAMRRAASDRVRFDDALEVCARFQLRLVEFVRNCPLRVICVSHERLVAEPHATIDSLRSHLAEDQALAGSHEIWESMLEHRALYRETETPETVDSRGSS